MNATTKNKAVWMLFHALAFCAVLLTSCTDKGGEDERQEGTPLVPTVADKSTYTLTVSAAKAGLPSASFAKGEAMEMYWQDDNKDYLHLGTLTAQSEGKATILTGELSLPAAMTKANKSGAVTLLGYSPTVQWDITGQDGTLETLSQHYFFSTAEINIPANGLDEQQKNVVLPNTTYTLTHALPIVHYTLRDHSGNAIAANRLVVSSATAQGEEAISIKGNWQQGAQEQGAVDITANKATSDFWVALSGQGGEAAPYTITAYTDSEVFVCHLENAAYSPEGYHEETLTMNRITEACITGKVVYPNYPNLTNYNFVYPSTGPFGEPVMLSGTMTMGREMLPGTKGRGLILYNHYTVCKADECPSAGKLDMQQLLGLMIPNSKLITISADYYGFGETGDKLQAYCIPSINARASLDALMAGRQLLKEEGFIWDEDELLNIGYSQGAQTAIAVQRLVDEHYPDIHITRTMAGGGPYDMEETYRQFVTSGKSGMPSTVISVLLTYNEYFRLGLPLNSMFIEPTLSHIDEWITSKQLTSTEIDKNVGTQELKALVAPALLDLDSDISRKVMAALSKETLCRGWVPNKDDDILLVHHEKDSTVPVENTQSLYRFLQEQGVRNVELKVGNFFSLGQQDHLSGATVFLSLVYKWTREHYGY